MKWFYVTALVAIGLLVGLPFLKRAESSPGAERVIGHNVYGSKVKSVDPASCGDTTSAGVQGSIYEGLYTYHYLKRPIEVVPLLASGMPEVSEDGLTYTIKLKKGVKYSRNPCFGRDPEDPKKWATRTVRAEDFVLAFKRIGDFHLTTALSLAFVEDKIAGLKEFRDRTRIYHKGDFSRYDKEKLPGVKAIDEHTLQFKLTRRFPQFQYVLAMHVYAPIPREVIDHHLAGGAKAIPIKRREPEIIRREAVVGTGPYLLAEWIKGNKIVLVRNAEFRDDHYPTEGGPGDKKAGLLADAGKKVPFVDEWHLTFVKEAKTAWMMFDKRLRDSAGIPRDMYSAVITPEKELREKWAKRGIRLIKGPYPIIYWIVFNMEDPVIGRSKSLRQALCLAFDVENYIKVVANGRGKRAVNVIPSSLKSHKAAGPGPYYKLDLEAAKKKIAQAKKEFAEAGMLRDGQIPELRFEMTVRDPRDKIRADFIKQQFAKVDVRLKIIANDWPTQLRKIRNKKAQIYTMGWHADYPDAENFLQLFYSPNIKRGTNNSNYSNKEFDRLFLQASAILEEERRVPLYAKMARIINEDAPVLLLSEPIGYVLVNQWVRNTKPHPIGYGFRKYIRIDAALRRRSGGQRVR